MKLIPDYVFDSIYEITPEFFTQHKIKGALFDLDGTLAPSRSPLPPETLTPYFASLEKAGIRIMVLSNNKEERVARFCETLGIPFQHRAYKPFAVGFQKAASKLGLTMCEVAVIGDQIYTDTFGGNCLGATTCFVRSLNTGDFLIDLRHQFERPFVWLGKRRAKEQK